MWHPTEGTEVAEGIGGEAVTTLSKTDKTIQPLGGQDTVTTPRKRAAEVTGGLGVKHIFARIDSLAHEETG